MVYICTLTRDSINANTVCDLIQVLKESHDAAFAAVVGTQIHALREGAVKAVLTSGATHILFVDSDMMFPKDTIKRLMSWDKDIISANYVQRVDQYKWTGKINDESVISVGLSGIQEVDTIGMGLCLINLDVFRKMKQPWFATPYENGGYMGEDTYFCNLAKANGYKIFIDHRLSQEVHHIGETYLGVDNFKVFEYTIPKIDGWMTEPEMQFLYSTAHNMSSVIELGSWKGRSTHALLSGCNGTVTAVDHWKGSLQDPTEDLAKQEDVFSIFKENLKDFKNLVILNKNIDDAVSEVEPAEMVFIDAEHNYEAVKRDLINWLPKAKKIICGHDYSTTFPGVVKAVSEVIGEPDGVVGTIWWKLIR